MNSVKPSLSVKTVSYRKYKAINIQDFQSDLAKSNLCTNHTNSLDELVSCYDETLKATLDKHAPLLTKTVVVRPRVPWFNEEIREAKRERRRAEKKWRKTKNSVDLTIFKVKRNAVVSLMNKARKEFYTNFIEENSYDQRKLFKASKSLLNCKPCNAIPSDIDEKQFAEDIRKFFVQKVLDIRNRLDNIHSSCEHETSIPHVAPTVQYLREFDKLTENDVKSIMQRSSLRSCLLDPMPSWLVNQCDVLLPVLTTLINTSLQSGEFPKAWKEALVLPLLKKPGLDCQFKNFRLVCNLPFTSKLTERAVFEQIQTHMCTNNLYPPYQSSYRRYFSTETSLLRVKNDILLNMNKQHLTLLILLDLSSAFDTVDHDILLKRLSSKFAVSGTVIEWLRSYLDERCQRILINTTQSSSFKLNFGVPQGSCLGPLLFTVYASKLFDVVKHHLPTVHCYADDTQLYVSFSPNDETGQDEAVAAVQRCVDDIRLWMTTDKLLLNDDKTEFVVIGTKQQLAKVQLNNITIGQFEITPTSSVRNLECGLIPHCQ